MSTSYRFKLFISTFFVSTMVYSIIIRHDKPDKDFLEFAREIKSTTAILYLNKTDVAGTLIYPTWVLTAAHVAADITTSDSLILGNNKFKVRNIFLHSGWQDDGPQDIALIQLEKAVKDINPVKIYKKKNELGKSIIVAGIGDYGTGQTGPLINDGRLRAATNKIDEVSENWLKWKFDNPETGSLNLTEYEGISGPGDSGGPAFIIENDTTYVAGISSGQSTRSTGGKEGIYGVVEYYTRVSSYQTWITEIVKRREDK